VRLQHISPKGITENTSKETSAPTIYADKTKRQLVKVKQLELAISENKIIKRVVAKHKKTRNQLSALLK